MRTFHDVPRARRAVVYLVLAVLAVLAASLAAPDRPGGAAAAPDDERASQKAPAASEPRTFRGRGRLVCLAEEMARLHKAAVQPIHEHVLGFRFAQDGLAPDGAVAPALRYYTILHTPQSKALFADKRFGGRDLVLIGRTFPGTAILEVSGWRWEREGAWYDVYYWCDVCSIRTADPGPCACCQGDVELREERAPDAPAAPKE
jgi:hypothetical protein